jgi:3-oxoacyl-[acyl-carrier protein] reductase
MELEGARALVTGAGRGIGATIALALAGSGCRVALVSRTESQLDAIAAGVTAAGVRTLVVPADLTRPDEVHGLVQKVESEFGGIDILVNNAGGGSFGPVLELTEADFERTLELNVTSVFRLTRAFLPGMLQRKQGHIVMMASTAARSGFAGGAAYCAAKFALDGFAQSLFHETRKSGVRVTTVFPSSVNTDLMRGLGPNLEVERMIQPADVALAVLAALRTDDRATVKEIEIWGTNPS